MVLKESKKKKHYNSFCNIINVFTITFDRLNASLPNKSINLKRN